MKKLLFPILAVVAALLSIATPAEAQCGTGQPPAGFVCAAPPTTAGVANYRALADGHIPSGINAAKIGGGSVSTTEYDRLDGITAFGQSLIDDADASAARTTLGSVIGTNVQAFDADLTTWAGISPSANAQSLVSAASYAAMRTLLDLEAGVDFYSIAAADAAFQPLDSDLTIWAGLTPSSNAQSLVTASNYAAMRALLDLEAGTDFYSIAGADAAFQPIDADLTSWASIARAAGFDTFVATPSSANLRSLISDELGTGSLLFGIHANMSDDISCNADEFLQRNGTDTGWECAVIPGGGDALKADPLSQFAATTSLQLRGVISDETGTGLLYFQGGDIGTPSAGNLANATGLPIAGLTPSTSTAIGVGSVELGHASDTTITRSAAGVVQVEGSTLAKVSDVTNKTESFCFAMSDETTNLTTGTAKIKFRMPYAFTVTDVRSSLSTAQTAGSIITVDLNENGSTILSTKLTIDNSESTSTTAATPPVISDSALADDSEISGDIDQVGTPLAKGLKTCIIGHQ